MSAGTPNNFSRHAAQAPDAVSPNKVCRVFSLPDNPEFMAAVLGLLATLTYNTMWYPGENVDSTHAASVISEMLGTMKECPSMIGHIYPTTRRFPNDNELFCHGQVVSRFDYPELYAAMHPAFRSGANGLKIPDLRGRLPMGANTDPFADLGEYWLDIADEDGQAMVTLNEYQIPAHTHTTQPHTHTDAGHTHMVPNVMFNVDLEAPGIPNPIGAAIAPPIPSGISHAVIQPETVTVNPTGGGGGHDNIPPVVGLNYVIVVR